MSLDPFVVDPWPEVPPRLKIRMLDKDIGGVTGLMPQQVNVSFSNSWQPAMSDIARSFNTGAKAMQETFNQGGRVDLTADFKELTNQIWTGTSPMNTNLNLTYLSRSKGPLKEVLEPVDRILLLCGPAASHQAKRQLRRNQSISITMLKPPHPFMLEIGYVMAWREAIPTSVAIMIRNISDSDGLPTRVDVQLGLQTDKSYVVQDPDFSLNSGKWFSKGTQV